MTRHLLALALPVSLLAAAGCQNRLHDENLMLYEENRELRTQLESGGGSMDGVDPALVSQLEQELSEANQLIDTLNNELAAAESRPVAQPTLPEIDGAETSFDARTGEMTVSVAGDVLFGSGRSDLKDSAKQTLAELARVLQNDFAGDPVRVEGHTDSDPVTKTRKTYTDNFGLSSARALTVMRYLAEQGVDPARMEAVAKGEHEPRSNDKADNRRVEIVVLTR